MKMSDISQTFLFELKDCRKVSPFIRNMALTGPHYAGLILSYGTSRRTEVGHLFSLDTALVVLFFSR